MSILPSIPLGHAKDPQENRKETFCRWQEGKYMEVIGLFPATSGDNDTCKTIANVLAVNCTITMIRTASTMLQWFRAEK